MWAYENETAEESQQLHTVSHDGIALEDDTLAGLESGHLACGVLSQQIWGGLTRSNLDVNSSVLGSDEDLGELRALVSEDLISHCEIRMGTHSDTT